MSSRMIFATLPEMGSYCTTGQFEKLGKGYQQHCGPTAITNLILAIEKREGSDVRGQENYIFKKVAEYGRNALLYANMTLFGYWGGTNDMGASLYIRKCLEQFGIQDYDVKHRRLFTVAGAAKALRKGSLLYLELRHHPKYKNHHVLCYGMGKQDGEMVLLLADGWSGRPVYAPIKDLKLAYMIEIEKQ